MLTAPWPWAALAVIVVVATAGIEKGATAEGEAEATPLLRAAANALSEGACERSLELLDEVHSVELSFRPHVFRLRGVALGCLGEHEKAIQSLSEALALSPMDVWALQSRCFSLARLGSFAAARRDCEQAVKLASSEGSAASERDRAAALNSLGSLYEGFGLLQKAIDTYSLALEETNASYIYVNRAGAYEAIGHFQEASQDLEKAIDGAMEHELPEMHWRLGRVLRERGELEKALVYFDRAVERDSNQAKFWYAGCLTLLDLQRADEAKGRCEIAVERDPANLLYLDARGLARLESGDGHGALEDFSAILERDPDNPLGLLHSALANEKLGQWDAARTAERAIRAKYPGWQALEVLTEAEKARWASEEDGD